MSYSETAEPALSISAVERETGLSKDTLRIWERRYRFPEPLRDMNGERVYSHAQVWVNGRRMGAHEGGFLPFELDITDAVKIGAENEILVLVDARSMAADLDHASYFAYFELAGIWQPIEVFATSPVYLAHLAVSTVGKTWRCSWTSIPA